MTMENIGEAIQKARLVRRLSQYDLAKVIGVRYEQIAKVETRAFPRSKHLRAIVEFLQIAVDEEVLSSLSLPTGGRKPKLGELMTERVVMVMTPSELRALDDWRFKNRLPSRSDAFRKLMAAGISSFPKGKSS